MIGATLLSHGFIANTTLIVHHSQSASRVFVSYFSCFYVKLVHHFAFVGLALLG